MELTMEQKRALARARARIRMREGGGDSESANNTASAASAPEIGDAAAPRDPRRANLAFQGLTFGFSDEIGAGVGALADYVLDGTPLPDAYARRVTENRAALDEERERRGPAWSLAAEMAGAMIAPGGVVSAGKSMVTRLARGSAAGAGAGALYGAGTAEGDISDRVEGAVYGAGTGAVGGLAGAGAGEAISAAVPAAQRLYSRARGAVGGGRGDAARRVSEAIDLDRRLGAGGLDDAAFDEALSVGQPVANIDRGGRATQALARSAADSSVEARATLEPMLADRALTQAARVSSYLDDAAGGADAFLEREALRSAARAANSPRYRLAYEKGDKPIRSETLDRLMTSPSVARAMKVASERGKDRAVAEGFGGFNTAVQVTDDGRVLFEPGRNGAPAYPNLAFWDETKQVLDDAVGEAQRQGRTREAARLTGITSNLRAELDRIVPEYRVARQSAAQFFGAEDALEAGEKYVRGRVSPSEAKQALGKMSDPERKLFRKGFASQLISDIQRMNDHADVGRAFRKPAIREKMEIAFGARRAKEIEARILAERVMQMSKDAVTGNSKTARYLQDMMLAGGTGGATYLAGGDPSTAMLVGALSLGGRRVASKIRDRVNEKLAKEVADLLASSDPATVTRGIHRIAGNNMMLTNLRNALIMPAAVGGGVAATEMTN